MNAARNHPEPHGPTPADLDPETGDWSRKYIRYRLDRAGFTQVDVGRRLGLKDTAVVDTLRGRRSRRVEREIAHLLGAAPEQIWPSRYAERRQGERRHEDRRQRDRRSVHAAGLAE